MFTPDSTGLFLLAGKDPNLFFGTASFGWQHWNIIRRTARILNPIHFVNVNSFHEIYLGHTPTMNWKTDKPMRAVNVLNIDTGTRQGGKLTIMDVRTKEYWQSDPVNELYAASNIPAG